MLMSCNGKNSTEYMYQNSLMSCNGKASAEYMYQNMIMSCNGENSAEYMYQTCQCNVTTGTLTNICIITC